MCNLLFTLQFCHVAVCNESQRAKRLILYFTTKLHNVITMRPYLALISRRLLSTFSFQRIIDMHVSITFSRSSNMLLEIKRCNCFKQPPFSDVSLLMCVFSTPETSVTPQEKFTVDASGGGDEPHIIIISKNFCHKLVRDHQYREVYVLLSMRGKCIINLVQQRRSSGKRRGRRFSIPSIFLLLFFFFY